MDDIRALKRLQREVFSDLMSIKQRLDDLTPAPKAGEPDEERIIPTEGASVASRPQRLAYGTRLRAKAQLTGSVESVAAVAYVQDSGADGGTSCGANGAGSRLTLLLQSLSADERSSLSARLAAQAGETSQGMQLEQLLFRHELPSGVSVLLAPLGGALANIACKVNPFAVPGLSREMRVGHGLRSVLEGGAGGGASWSGGPVSAAAGHFTTGVPGGTRHHTVAQIGLCWRDSLSASFVARQAMCSSHPPGWPFGVQPATLAPQSASMPSQPGADGAGDTGAATDADSHSSTGNTSSSTATADRTAMGRPSGTVRFSEAITPAVMPLTGTEAAGCGGGPATGAMEFGVAGSWVAYDSVVVSAWRSEASAGAPAGWGVRLASVPDGSGQQLAAGLMRTWDSDHRCLSPPTLEVSGSVPLADGISANPSVLVQRRQDGSLMAAAAVQTTWRF